MTLGQKRFLRRPGSKFFHGDHLTTFVKAATGAGNVGEGGAAALGAHIELPRTPLLAGATEALLHFGGFAFWDCHGKLRVLWSAHLNGFGGNVNAGIRQMFEKS